MGRSILAVVLGLVLQVLVTSAIHLVGGLLWPSGPLPQTAAEWEALMAKMPLEAKLFVILAHSMGALAGAALAARIARRAPVKHGMIVGALVMAAGLGNLLMIPHPTWMWIADLSLYLPAAYAGARLFGPKPEPPPAAATE